MSRHRDHGGGLDAAVARFGGEKSDWIDLSTGINPVPYPLGELEPHMWAALPDAAAQDHLIQAARAFWKVPHNAAILAVPGASSAIARIPALWPRNQVEIQTPTYNEHAGAFEAQNWEIHNSPGATRKSVQVAVHPNNPDGRMWNASEFTAGVTIIDESFCDICPDDSHIARTSRDDTLVLKSFGKFWGLAGLRLGFVIGAPELVSQLSHFIGPWAVSGPALAIGARALTDDAWAEETRARLAQDAARLDQCLAANGATPLGGTDLFRLYDVDDARAWQEKLAHNRVWSRIFPYSDRWVRLGLPAPDDWAQLETAL